MASTTTAPKTGKADPKPSAKRLTAAQRKAASDKVADELASVDVQGAVDEAALAAAQDELDASPSISPEDVEEEGATIDFRGRRLAVPDADDEDAPSAQVDVKAKVREASKATLARRAKNAADKAKTSERKAQERDERAKASSAFKAQVIAAYTKTPDVAKVAAKFTNERTGLPYSQMRIRRILNEAGVLVTTKRGDTSERDARIVQQIESGMEVAEVATEHGLSAARVRGIAKKAGLVLDGGRTGKLPKVGTPEWAAFVADVDALTEKYGVALGTMAHALRKA